MTASDLQALWQKICNQFSTKSEMVAAVATRQAPLTAGDGITIYNNVISCDFGAEEEVATITLTTDIQDLSMENRQILVYFNGNTTADKTLTTDEDGMATLRVPKAYKYRLAFPTIDGCNPIADVTYTAAIAQRSIEVEYTPVSYIPQEYVRLYVKRKTTEAITALADVSVTVTVDNIASTYTTDSNGLAEFYVDNGKTYSISLPASEGYNTPAVQTYTAEKASRSITLYYRYITSALSIIDSDANEYTFDEFQAAVQAEEKTKMDAVAIKVSTNDLIDANGVFLIGVEDFTVGTHPSKAWAASNVLFTSIPQNGNSSSAAYYYDGKTASVNIQEEGDSRTIDTPAVDEALSRSLTINNVPHPGFLGSTGQWNILWSNRTALDDILDFLRPNTTRLSQFTQAKWTSTQLNAYNAYRWTGSANDYNKYYSSAVVAFFAY